MSIYIPAVIDARKPGFLGKGKKVRGGSVRLAPGESVGEHSTIEGEEFILVLEGKARITIQNHAEPIYLQKDHCLFIPQNTIHNVQNDTNEALIYVYFVGGKKEKKKENNAPMKEAS